MPVIPPREKFFVFPKRGFLLLLNQIHVGMSVVVTPPDFLFSEELGETLPVEGVVIEKNTRTQMDLVTGLESTTGDITIAPSNKENGMVRLCWWPDPSGEGHWFLGTLRVEVIVPVEKALVEALRRVQGDYTIEEEEWRCVDEALAPFEVSRG